MRKWVNKVNLSNFSTQNLFQIRAGVISARKAKQVGVTTMFTYSHSNTALGQSERAYYLSYFIKIFRIWAIDLNWKQRSDYTLGHASPDKQRHQGKQVRHSSERQGEEDLPTHCYVSPKWKRNLFKNSRKTFEVQGSRSRNCENIETKPQQLSQWPLVLSGLSRRGLKTTSEISQDTSE